MDECVRWNGYRNSKKKKKLSEVQIIQPTTNVWRLTAQMMTKTIMCSSHQQHLGRVYAFMHPHAWIIIIATASYLFEHKIQQP